MLDYALEHRKAVDTVTQRRDLHLRKYELADHEWEIVEQLRDVLKVRVFITTSYSMLITCVDSQRRHIVLFPLNTKPCHCNTCNGPHRREAHIILTQQEVYSLNPHCCSTGKEDTQSLLRTHGQFRSISHRYGYVLYIFSFYFSANIILYLVLHPRHKLSYFKAARWEDDWIQTAESLIHDEFERSYLSVDTNSDFGSVEEMSGPGNDQQVCSFSFCVPSAC
jgi:hypothetical protein